MMSGPLSQLQCAKLCSISVAMSVNYAQDLVRSCNRALAKDKSWQESNTVQCKRAPEVTRVTSTSGSLRLDSVPTATSVQRCARLGFGQANHRHPARRIAALRRTASREDPLVRRRWRIYHRQWQWRAAGGWSVILRTGCRSGEGSVVLAARFPFPGPADLGGPAGCGVPTATLF
jgi:hypothetical protein